MFKVPTLIAQFTHFCVACSTQSVYILSLSSTALPTVLWHPSRRKKIGTGLHKWICQCWNFWITVRPQEQPFSTVHKSRNKMKQTVSNSIKQYQTIYLKHTSTILKLRIYTAKFCTESRLEVQAASLTWQPGEPPLSDLSLAMHGCKLQR